jgi:PAS domain-containing protein
MAALIAGSYDDWQVALFFVIAFVVSYIALLVVSRNSAVIDRRLSAQQLELDCEREILRALLNNIPDLMYVKNTKSRFILANPPVAKLMGVDSPDDLIGKTAFDFLPAERVTPSYAMEQEGIAYRSSPRQCLCTAATVVSQGLQA